MQEEKPLVPMMMTQGYRAKGWLGLILGNALWHAFHAEAVPTQDKFIEQMDRLADELGGRGKKLGSSTSRAQPQPQVDSAVSKPVSEGVPPAAGAAPPRPHTDDGSGSTTPPRTGAAAARARAEEEAAEASSRFSPSMHQPSPILPPLQQQQVSVRHPQEVGAGGGGLADVVVLLREQRKESRADRDELAEMMARQADQLRGEIDAKLAAAAIAIASETRQREEEADYISCAQIAALQARLSACHAAKQLKDEELFELEDLVADFAELRASVPNETISESMVVQDAMVAAGGGGGGGGGVFEPARKLRKLIGVSAAMPDNDASFSRQAKRKFLS